MYRQDNSYKVLVLAIITLLASLSWHYFDVQDRNKQIETLNYVLEASLTDKKVLEDMLNFEPSMLCVNPTKMKLNGTMVDTGLVFTVQISTQDKFLPKEMLYGVADKFEQDLDLECVEVGVDGH